MIETKIAIRYSKALFGLALEKNILDDVYLDVLHVYETLSISKDLFHVLKSPIIRGEKKRNIAREVFENKINEVTLDFIFLTIKKRREGALKDIAVQFIGSYKEYKNILPVNIIAAQQIEEDAKAKIIEMLSEKTHKQIELNIQTDPSLIGGFVVNYEDKQLDASVRNKIHKLNKEFNINNG